MAKNNGRGPMCLPPVASAHPLVKFIYGQMLIERISQQELAKRSGVPHSTIKGWFHARRGVSPKISSIENVLGVFDLGLKPTPLQKEKHHANSQ